MKLAQKNKIENSWLAFIPIANMYLLGKLGFEIYAEEDRKKTNFAIIMMLLAFGSITLPYLSNILSLIDYDFISNLLSIILYVTMVMAYNKVYSRMIPSEATKYTILSALFGGIPLLISAGKIIAAENISQTSFKENTLSLENQNIQNEQDNIKKEELRKQNSGEKSKNESNFCSSCGTKITEKAKFCSNCGKEV